MATISYTVTHLGQRRSLIEWPTMVNGDVGQLWSPIKSVPLSYHGIFTSGAAATLDFMATNGTLHSNSVAIVSVSMVTNPVFAGFVNFPEARHFFPRISAGAGTVTVRVLFKNLHEGD